LAELQPSDPPRVGPYVLLGRLGSGGMGQVFLGRSPGGRLVAVKVIRAQLADDRGFRARFAREVEAARKVGGLFTAPVVDAELDGPVPWLVTAYVPGLSLADAVTRHGPLPVASVTALAAGLAEGLGAIHAARVIHRDLKPSNVLLASDGPRIIDFGIASAAEATALTGTGFLIGSPGFMSPEQARGLVVGPASDIFSLGAVLGFAATGEGPFGRGETPALVYRVVHGKPDTSRVPDPLRSMLERCLVKDPARRPTAAQFLSDLTAAYPSAPNLSGDWLPRQVLAASTAAAVPARDADRHQPAAGTPHSAALPSGSATQTAPPRQAPVAVRDVARRRPLWPWLAGGSVVCAAVIATLIVALLPGSTPPTTAEHLRLAQLRTGDCLTGSNLSLGTSSPWPDRAAAVPCGRPHIAEVFFADDAYWPNPYPGDTVISHDADAKCGDAYRAYVGVSDAHSIYNWDDIFPDATDWNQGARELICVAFHPTLTAPRGTPITGSIKNSKR
jgi:hypothetical protein